MGILYIVATPIGNLEDITFRAIKTLFSVDYIACEDTRKTGNLLTTLCAKYSFMVRFMKVKLPKLISYYDEVESKKIPEILTLLAQNKNIALVSDSGTPLISDPGYKLIKECIKRGIKLVSLPGPSALITALPLSGLPLNHFLFLGYLPTRQSRRYQFLKYLQTFWQTKLGKRLKPTFVAFETPHRLKESLLDIKQVFGDIEMVIGRELTKIHEEVWRGKISQILEKNQNFKGEFVLIFSIPQE